MNTTVSLKVLNSFINRQSERETTGTAQAKGKSRYNWGFFVGVLVSLLMSPILASPLLCFIKKSDFQYGMRGGIGSMSVGIGLSMGALGALAWLNYIPRQMYSPWDSLNECQFKEFLSNLNTYDFSMRNGYQSGYSLVDRQIPLGWTPSTICQERQELLNKIIQGTVSVASALVVLGLLLLTTAWKELRRSTKRQMRETLRSQVALTIPPPVATCTFSPSTQI
jgi:undecaprenyl pyrophosphate phosphatase UppP